MANMDLSVIVVNYNARELLKGCLQSIYDNTRGINFEVIVVDNASRDGSGDAVSENFPQVKLIKNQENVGFGRANNIGLAIAEGEHILFLNCDTKVTRPYLEDMVATARKKSGLGALGVALYSSEYDSEPQPCYGQFPSLWQFLRWYTFVGNLFPLPAKKNRMNSGECGNPEKTDVVSGACLFIPKKVINDVGVFDEKFFMYFEEFDLCRRIKKAGYDVYFDPSKKIIHYGNKSAESPEFLAQKNSVLKQSILRYLKKHHNLLAYLIFIGALNLGSVLNYPQIAKRRR